MYITEAAFFLAVAATLPNKDLYSVAVTPAEIDSSSTPPKAVLISSLYCLEKEF